MNIAGAVDATRSGDEAELVLNTTSSVLAEVRRAKTEAKVSQRAKVDRLLVTCDDASRVALEFARNDLVNAGNITTFDVVAGQTLAVTVTLAPQP